MEICYDFKYVLKGGCGREGMVLQETALPISCYVALWKETNYITKLFKKSNLRIVYTSNNSDQHLLRLKTGAGYEKKFHRSVLYELTCRIMFGLGKEIHRQNWQELKKNFTHLKTTTTIITITQNSPNAFLKMTTPGKSMILRNISILVNRGHTQIVQKNVKKGGTN